MPSGTGTRRRTSPASGRVLGKVDVFVLVYPIWFGTPPAMLKGYIDRVFGAGRTFGQGGEGGTSDVLAGKRLVSLTSSGSHRAWLAEKGVLGSLRTVYDRYFADVFGFTETHRYHFDGVDRGRSRARDPHAPRRGRKGRARRDEPDARRPGKLTIRTGNDGGPN